MIYISFVVPSYNAEKYLDRNLPSLAVGGDDVEIIVVNDGSKDNTLALANSYAEKYSNIKVIDKENGGHGSTINEALKVAQGLYFKCVDADDWLDEEAYLQLLSLIKKHVEERTNPDLYLTNFVYNRLDDGTTSWHDFSKTYPTNKLMTWKDLKAPNNMDFFMMHMMLYKTEILRQSGLELPLHTFYVDNLFVYQPLFYVKTMYYLPVKLYQYYVGHQGQSISYENMSKNWDHEMRVYDLITHCYTMDDFNKLSKYHKRYMVFALLVNAALALFYSVAGKKKGAKKVFNDLNKKWKKDRPRTYRKVNYGSRYILSKFIFIPILRDMAVKIGYEIVKAKTGWY